MKTKTVKWKFDISSYRLLGRELITDRITAVFELVKNCYDANAENVSVEFYNVSENKSDSMIIIKDDGFGMTLDDIENKWMTIGTNNKRVKTITDPPYNRRVVGEKGIGRFAVDKLGSNLILKTKKKGEDTLKVVEINWRNYAKLSKEKDKEESFEKKKDKKDAIKNNVIKKNDKKLLESSENKKNIYFTDIENKCKFEPSDKELHGTELIITEINDIWSDKDIDRIYKELSKLISPFKIISSFFNIKIFSNEYSKYNNIEVENFAIKYATIEKKLEFNQENKLQNILEFNKDKGNLEIASKSFYNFGPVRLHLYFFDSKAKTLFKRFYKNKEIQIDGIKIYRDGLITTPFAEYEENLDKRRDILGIDKRRWSGFFSKINSHDLIGFLEITGNNNPKIIDSTNRQDFVDNKEYRNLKDFIISQIVKIEEYLEYKKKEKKNKTKLVLEDAKNDITDVIDQFNIIKEKIPDELSSEVNKVIEKVKDINNKIDNGIRQHERLEYEKTRQEDLFLSLMSLQDYAAEIAHVVRTGLSKILHLAEFFKENFPDESKNDYFKKYSIRIFDQMLILGKAVEFMLSYSKAQLHFEDIDLKQLIIDIFEHHAFIFEREGIDYFIEINETVIIKHNKKFLEDIFENLISNSVKAIDKKQKKIIKCSSFIDKDKFTIYFSDNGIGITNDIKERIFDIYFTTTAEDGGAGIGLFIVQKRIESLKGHIELIKSEYSPNGATFKITIPFKQ